MFSQTWNACSRLQLYPSEVESCECPIPRLSDLVVAHWTDQEHYDLIERTSQPHFGLVHAFYAVMGGFAFDGSDMDEMPTVEESLVGLSTNPRLVVEVPRFETLTYIMKYFPQIITDTDEETILDRAESSSLSKALLIAQVVWFCTNCASRLIQRLPLSLLEVSTAAHAFCTLLTYVVWWSKPLNVATPTMMRGKQAREVYALLKCDDVEYEKALEMARKRAAGGSSGPTGREKTTLAANALEHLLPNPQKPPKHYSRRFFGHRPNMIPGAFGRRSTSNDVYEDIVIAVSPLLYGVIHFLAWNDHFPTPLERLLWRVSSAVVTFSGIVGMPLSFASSLIGDNFSGTLGTIFHVTTIFIILLAPTAHVVSSGFLIVESFRQLFFLEPAAYQIPSWTNYWPHFS